MEMDDYVKINSEENLALSRKKRASATFYL